MMCWAGVTARGPAISGTVLLYLFDGKKTKTWEAA